MSKPTVTVYTSSQCWGCTKTKEKLTAAGVEFTEINVEEDEVERETLRALGFQQTPVVVTSDGEAWGGLVPAKIQALVARAGA